MAGFKFPTMQTFSVPFQLQANQIPLAFLNENLSAMPSVFGGFNSAPYSSPLTIDPRAYIGGGFGCTFIPPPGPTDFFSKGVDAVENFDDELSLENDFARDFRDRRRESIREMRKVKREKQRDAKRFKQSYRLIG